MSPRGIALLCLVAIASAKPTVGRVLHAEPALPQGWRKGALLQSGNGGKVAFVVSLKQPEEGLEAVRSHALRVSTPSDPLYGQYMSSAEIISLCQPTEAVVAVAKGWFSGCDSVTLNRELLSVECTVEAAQAALQTTLWTAYNQATKQSTLRAGDYYLPSDVSEAVTTVYGLHGLPLPPRSSKVGAPKAPATVTPRATNDVTPAVLRATYNVGNATGSSNVNNRQAVASFESETMNSTDLAEFFKLYVPSAAPEDAKVYAFQGDPGEGLEGYESALDIQYIMGIAPKILTEFWHQQGDELTFCLDMKNWAGDILTTDNPPLVHSVSYVYQGDITLVAGCSTAVVLDVDADFAKLAALGISIIIASGDSGSGVPTSPLNCTSTLGIQLQGTVKENKVVESLEECCYLLGGGPGFTYHDNTSWCGGGNADTAVTGPFSQNFTRANKNDCCYEATQDGYAGYNWIPTTPDSTDGMCYIFKTVTGTIEEKGTQSSGLGVPAHCEIFSNVTGKVADASVQSGGDCFIPGPRPPLEMWPSWPASSPWVTSVGATRFVNQTVGHAEMASVRFGSGGGFSRDFAAFDFQKNATAGYLQNAPNLPPKGSYPPEGRGTADVSVLGEGYQVMVTGEVELEVFGTSASCPAFAGLVSLLNEERLAAGMPPMGYLNPWIYANPQAFNDITLGTNAINRQGVPDFYGFDCTEGWDPATGLGTPLFDKMLKAALAA